MMFAKFNYVSATLFCLLFFSVAGGLVGYVYRHPVEFGVCQETYFWDGRPSYIGCFDDTPQTIGWPLTLYSPLFGISAFFILFARRKIQKIWLIFSTFFVPLSILLIYRAPIISSDWITPFDKKLTSKFMGISLLLITIGMIIYDAVREWRRARNIKVKP